MGCGGCVIGRQSVGHVGCGDCVVGRQCRSCGVW